MGRAATEDPPASGRAGSAASVPNEFGDLTFSLEGVDLLRHITRTYAAVCTVTAVWFCFEPGLLIGRFEQTMRCFAGLARSEARSSHETHNGDFAIEL